MNAFRVAAFTLVAVSRQCRHGPRALAQDTTFRGITLVGNYDPLRDKIPIAVLPVSGAFGDSVRAIIQRDLDFSDRFTSFCRSIARIRRRCGATGAAASGSTTPIFHALTPPPSFRSRRCPPGFTSRCTTSAKAQVVNVGDFALPAAGLSRDWRLGRASGVRRDRAMDDRHSAASPRRASCTCGGEERRDSHRR